VYTIVAPLCGMIADKSVRQLVLYRNIFIESFYNYLMIIPVPELLTEGGYR